MVFTPTGVGWKNKIYQEAFLVVNQLVRAFIKRSLPLNPYTKIYNPAPTKSKGLLAN